MVSASMPATKQTRNERRHQSRSGKNIDTLRLTRVESAAGNRARPAMPMNTAAIMEITAHVVAIRRDFFSSSSWRMAINRSNTWGIPKYTKDHDMVEITVRKP